MSLCDELAQRVCAYTAADLDDATRRAAATAIIDTVGVTLLGSVEQSTRIALALPGLCEASGPATVFGTDVRTTALDAAMVNGIAAHALDFDDFTEDFGGHPSVPILPALIALAQERDATWSSLVAAYVVGVELETRLAHAVVGMAEAACRHWLATEPDRAPTEIARQMTDVLWHGLGSADR